MQCKGSGAVGLQSAETGTASSVVTRMACKRGNERHTIAHAIVMLMSLERTQAKEAEAKACCSQRMGERGAARVDIRLAHETQRHGPVRERMRVCESVDRGEGGEHNLLGRVLRQICPTLHASDADIPRKASGHRLMCGLCDHQVVLQSLETMGEGETVRTEAECLAYGVNT